MNFRRAPRRAVLAASAALVTVSCDHGEPRAELARVSRAVDVLREAPAGSKRRALEELEVTPCTDPGVCELRARCAAAYTLHVRATEATATVRRELEADGGAASAARLAAAERDLRASLPETEACSRRQSELHRTLGLR